MNKFIFKMSLLWAVLLVVADCAMVASRKPAGEAGQPGSAGPFSEVFRLHSGRKVLLPKRSDSVDYVFLQGDADVTALTQLLASEDLVPFVGQNNRGAIGVMVAKYNSSSIGPYQEVLVLISAQPKSLTDSGVFAGNQALPASGPAPVKPYYIAYAQMDSPLALEMNHDVWGVASTPGIIELSTKGASDWSFRVSGKNKGLIFEGKCGNCGVVGKQRLPASFTLISGYGIRRTFAHVENMGQTLVRPYDASVDAFNVKPNSALAVLLKRLSFQPYGWFVGEGLSAEAF